VTLHCLLAAEAGRGGDFLVMDADVLYDHRILRTLVETPHRNCFLLDRAYEPGEEPVKLLVRGGRPVEFRKQPAPTVAFDVQGESVGFFRFDRAMGARLLERAAAYLPKRRLEPYEEVIRDLVLADGGAFAFEDVTGLPWIEIDFAQDVARAESEVLPALVPLPASAAPERLQ
jgi:choline kinase